MLQVNKNITRSDRLTTLNSYTCTILNGVIVQNMLQLNDDISVMPAHFKTRVFDVIPHSVNLGYLIHNYITYFIIIRFINPLNPQALAHLYAIYFTFPVPKRS